MQRAPTSRFWESSVGNLPENLSWRSTAESCKTAPGWAPAWRSGAAGDCCGQKQTPGWAGVMLWTESIHTVVLMRTLCCSSRKRRTSRGCQEINITIQHITIDCDVLYTKGHSMNISRLQPLRSDSAGEANIHAFTPSVSATMCVVCRMFHTQRPTVHVLHQTAAWSAPVHKAIWVVR